MTGDIRVLLVDDHPAVLLGLSSVLNAAPDMVVVGAERDGAQGLAAFLRLRPDVVVLDVSMPGECGLVVMQRILAHNPDTTVLVLTADNDDKTLASALDAGAAGYALKGADSSEVVRAVRMCGRGGRPIDERLRRAALIEQPADAELPELTQRERDVLDLLRQGLANKQIAGHLGIGDSTVKTHLRNAFERIGVSDRTSAAIWAERHLHPAAMT
jgi:DNA-binding NarL/FixJ family response regulator